MFVQLSDTEIAFHTERSLVRYVKRLNETGPFTQTEGSFLLEKMFRQPIKLSIRRMNGKSSWIIPARSSVH